MLRLDGPIADDLDLAGSVLGPSLTSVGPGTVLAAWLTLLGQRRLRRTG